jgi:glutathione S-transferase
MLPRMAEILLHNYPGSPFAEKARTLMGFKQVEWRYVEIPAVLPKPDLVALTGGYRKTPVMQVGRDVYCDTRTIESYLEKVAPEPPLLLPGQEALCLTLAQWADTAWFNTVVPLCFSERGFASMRRFRTPQQIEMLVADRRALRGGSAFPPIEACEMNFRTFMRRISAQLTDKDYLLGAAPCLVDIAHYHPLFLLRNLLPEEMSPYPLVESWYKRMASIGHGKMTPLSSEEALQIARDTRESTDPLDAETVEIPGVKLGDHVSVAPIDSGSQDPVVGELVISGPREVAVRRADERAGEVVVHFPTVDFAVLPA